MNLKCFLKGHNIINGKCTQCLKPECQINNIHNIIDGKCTQCLKSECQINGCKWVYSDIKTIHFQMGFNESKASFPTKRKCLRCNIIEQQIDSDWTRIA